MRADCPVCEATLPTSVTHCPGCGFPAVLYDRLGASTPFTRPPRSAPTAPVSTVAPVAEGPPSPSSQLAERTARELRRKGELLARLGVDAGTLSRSLCDAMLRESSGEVEPALAELKAAERTADGSVRAALTVRLGRLKQRRGKLIESGVELPRDKELDRLEENLLPEEPWRAAELLLAIEERFALIESQWHGLEQAFAQVADLRALAAKAGFPVTDVTSRTDATRSRLGSGPVRPEVIARAVRETTQEQEALAHVLAGPLRAELDRLGGALHQHPDDRAERNRRRALQDRAADDLSAGRTAEALRAVLELRSLLGAAAPVPPSHATPAAPSAPVAKSPEPGTPPGHTASSPSPRPGSDVSIDSLLAKARSFAVRVRTLPPESEAGQRAAAQIHEATELLRKGRLVEADQALTRLMHTLASPGGST